MVEGFGQHLCQAAEDMPLEPLEFTSRISGKYFDRPCAANAVLFEHVMNPHVPAEQIAKPDLKDQIIFHLGEVKEEKRVPGLEQGPCLGGIRGGNSQGL